MATHPTIDHPRVRADAREQLLAGLPVTERRIPLAGVSTAVLEGGDGPPVVLLHGPAGNAAHWMRVIPGLASTRRVIVPDLPGHGASMVDDAGELDAERVGAWLGELIERTCPSPPVLVGYALGGAIAAPLRGRPRRPPQRAGARGLARAGAPSSPPPTSAPPSSASWRTPTRRRTTGLWRQCAFDLDRVREEMGERWQPFEAFNVDQARTPSAMGALGSLMAHFGDAGGRAGADQRPDHADLGPARPRDPARGRAGGEPPPRLAAPRHRGLRRRPADRAARRLPARAGPCARRGRGAGVGRGGVRGRDRRPRPPALRRAPQGLQRDGRPAPGAHRPLRERPGRGDGRRIRPRQRPCACPCTAEATTSPGTRSARTASRSISAR